MAISVDTVYQKVLALANKEQRGYITPQEFNLFANQAQMAIFEQYFYDLNQFRRVPGNDTNYADMVEVLEQKIQIFEYYFSPLVTANWEDPDLDGEYFLDSWGDEVYRISQIIVDGKNVEIVNSKDFNNFANSPLTKPTNDRPIATITKMGLAGSGSNDSILRVSKLGSLEIWYIRKPITVNWGYTVFTAAQSNVDALYNPNASTDFELHASDQGELVNRILALAGVSIQKPELTQVAAGLEQGKTQQEKQ